MRILLVSGQSGWRIGGFHLSGTRQMSDGKRGVTLCAPRSPSLSKVTKSLGLGEEGVKIITPVVCDPRARYELVFAECGPIAGLDAGAARHHAGHQGPRGRSHHRRRCWRSGTARQRAGHVARIERLALCAMTDPRCMTEHITDWRVAVMREIDGEARLHHFTTRPE